MKITVDIPAELEISARNVAARTHCKVEGILQEWLNQFVSEVPVSWLGESGLLELITKRLSDNDERELSDLLAINRERIMAPDERNRLNANIWAGHGSKSRSDERGSEAWHDFAARELRYVLP